jgi:hypothetical protein
MAQRYASRVKHATDLFPWVYCICWGNEGTPSPVNDVDSYVIIKNLIDSVVSIYLAFIRRWEIETVAGLSFLRLTYIHHVPWAGGLEGLIFLMLD